MKELKYLSVKATVDVKNIVGLSKNVNEKLKLGDKFPSVYAKAKHDTDHFFIEIDGKQIPCSKSSKTEVRKVTAGQFKGDYVLIERNGGSKEKTSVYLLHDEGFVPLAEEQDLLDIAEIDEMLNNDYLARFTASMLNTFDLGKDNQGYKYFCQKLPTSLFTSKKSDFADRVVKHFFSMGEVTLIPNKNNRFVKTRLCKAEAYEYFDEFVQKKVEQDREMGE